MKFAVNSSTGYERLQSYKPILEKYNLEITTVKDEFDEDEECEMLWITINTLEELMALREEIGQQATKDPRKDIIICDYYYDAFLGRYEGPTIEIYDGYRE
jgi:hypothetical protein